MTRWITGIILALAVMALLLYAPLDWATYLVIGLSGVACVEFLSLFKKHSKFFSIGIGLLSAFGTMMMLYVPPIVLTLYFSVIFLLVPVLHFFLKDEPKELLEKIFICEFGVFYCIFLFGFLGAILQAPFHPFWIFYLMVTTFLADTGAFLGGKLFGKHLLAPRLSPKKTWEGLCGGVILAACGGVVVGKIFPTSISLWELGLCGGALAVTGLFGDLTESLFKRATGVKDSGNLIPGHGGLLDRIDALLFNAPMVVLMIWFLR